MRDYIGIQNNLIKEYDINLDINSSCWKRTHVHVKERRICKHAPKNSYSSLFTLLHEIGHVETDKSGMKRCEEESEATRWAVGKSNELGINVPKKIYDSYNRYTAMTYKRGLMRGLSKKVKLFGVHEWEVKDEKNIR